MFLIPKCKYYIFIYIKIFIYINIKYSTHFLIFLSLSTILIYEFHSYTKILILIPLIPTPIPRIPTPIPRIPTVIPRIPTVIPRIPIIPLIPFPDSPFRLWQIALKMLWKNSKNLSWDILSLKFLCNQISKVICVVSLLCLFPSVAYYWRCTEKQLSWYLSKYCYYW